MNRETQDKILNLLKHPDIANQHLAFSLMKSQGVPFIYPLEWLNIPFEPIWRFICESSMITAPQTELKDMDFGWRTDYFTIYEYCFVRWHPELSAIRNLGVENENLSSMDWSGFENLQHLEGITFRNCGFRQIPAPIFKLPKINYLDLTDNNIQEIPDEIQLLSNLEYLSLENNTIKTLSPILKILTKLKKLNLKDTKVTEIPDFILLEMGVEIVQ